MTDFGRYAAVLGFALGVACGDDAPKAEATSASEADSEGTATDAATGSTGLAPIVCADEPESTLRLACSVEQLAAFGEKRAGTPAGMLAGDYISDRFTAAGLLDVQFESFSFPSFELANSSLSVVIDGAASTPAHEVFAYSGTGSVDAEVVYVGTGHESVYDGLDVTGKVVFVERDPLFHRSSQYRIVTEHGAAAMLYRSASPDDLIQIGTVADPEDGLGAVPAFTIGDSDGRAVEEALVAGQTVRLVASVDATIQPSVGRNVVGWLPGSDPGGGYIVVGAHYDSWYAGAVDNCSGAAALTELAERIVAGGSRRLGIAFVAYDAEELGLFGGYDFLRRHVIVGGEPMLAFVNLEMPANDDPVALRAIAVTGGGVVGQEVDNDASATLYPFIVNFRTVTELFGGVIPTDIQGLYWAGFQGLTTVTDTPYYHTPQDTSDKVDTEFLALSVTHLIDVLDRLDDKSYEGFQVRDEELWQLEVDTTPSGSDLVVDVLVQDATGVPQRSALVRVWIDVDDFSRVWDMTVMTDDTGTASVTVPAAALAAGGGDRWLHATASDDIPLAEAILHL